MPDLLQLDPDEPKDSDLVLIEGEMAGGLMETRTFHRSSLPQLRHIPVLTAKEERVLFKALGAEPGSMKIKQEIAFHNLRLVLFWTVQIAKTRQTYLTLSDLFAEGYFGLFRAIELFDWQRGIKFSSYASWWIRQSITRAMTDQRYVVRLPVHLQETMGKYRQIFNEIYRQTGQEPSFGKVASRLKCSKEIKKTLESAFVLTQMMSLEEELRDKTNGDVTESLGDILPISLLGADREDVQNPQDLAEARMSWARVLELLPDVLEEREIKVICLRYGLGEDIELTLEKIGEMLDPPKKITRERVRQILAGALKKLHLALEAA